MAQVQANPQNAGNAGNGGNGGNIRLLEEVLDEDYKPTLAEIEEYAEWIGIDTQFDRDLFWIAKRGLKAPLPEPWRACATEEGADVFYFNFATGASVWEHPCDEKFRELAKARANRPMYAVTLTASFRQDGVAVVTGTNIAGETVCSATVFEIWQTRFGEVYKRLSQQLKLPKGTGLRFLLPDATMLGYKKHVEPIAEIFNLTSRPIVVDHKKPVPSPVKPSSKSKPKDASTPLKKVVVVLSCKQHPKPGHPLLVKAARPNGQVLCCIPVTDYMKAPFKEVKKRLARTMRLGVDEKPAFVFTTGFAVERHHQELSIGELLFHHQGALVRHVILEVSEAGERHCDVIAKTVSGDSLGSLTSVDAWKPWKEVEESLIPSLHRLLGGHNLKFSQPDGLKLPIPAGDACLYTALATTPAWVAECESLNCDEVCDEEAPSAGDAEKASQ